MANYNLVADSTFTPFTFAEMVAPYEKYQAIYDKERDRYDELAANALSTLSMIDKEADPELYNSYSAYLDKLNTVGDALAKGTLGEARQAGLYDLKREYYKQGLPITQAYALQQETKKLRASNPDRLYINPALKMSELMAGKRDNNISVSKKDIIQHAIQANSTDIINDFMKGIEKENLNVADIISKYQYNSEEDPFNIGDNTEAQNEAAVLYNDAVSSFVGDLLSKEYIPKAQREQMAWEKSKYNSTLDSRNNSSNKNKGVLIKVGDKGYIEVHKQDGMLVKKDDSGYYLPLDDEEKKAYKEKFPDKEELTEKQQINRSFFTNVLYKTEAKGTLDSKEKGFNWKDVLTSSPSNFTTSFKKSTYIELKSEDIPKLENLFGKEDYDAFTKMFYDSKLPAEDLVLLVDHDWIGNNHYAITTKEVWNNKLKDYNSKKETKDTPETPADTTNVNTSTPINTFKNDTIPYTPDDVVKVM